MKWIFKSGSCRKIPFLSTQAFTKEWLKMNKCIFGMATSRAWADFNSAEMLWRDQERVVDKTHQHSSTEAVLCKNEKKSSKSMWKLISCYLKCLVSVIHEQGRHTKSFTLATHRTAILRNFQAPLSETALYECLCNSVWLHLNCKWWQFWSVVTVYQVESVTDSEAESKGLPRFHSIGIQVEDKKRYVVQMKHSIMIIGFILFQVYIPLLYLSGVGGSSAPIAWQLQCKQTWNWRAFLPWRTKVCSLVVASAATLSPAHQHSMEPSGRYAHRACSVTGRTTGLRVGLPAHSLNPGWSNPAWRAPTQVECPPFAGTAAGSCSSFTMKPSGWKDGAKRWRERQRSMTCQRRVSVLRGALNFVAWCQHFLSDLLQSVYQCSHSEHAQC